MSPPACQGCQSNRRRNDGTSWIGRAWIWTEELGPSNNIIISTTSTSLAKPSSQHSEKTIVRHLTLLSDFLTAKLPPGKPRALQNHQLLFLRACGYHPVHECYCDLTPCTPSLQQAKPPTATAFPVAKSRSIRATSPESRFAITSHWREARCDRQARTARS